MNYFLMNKDHFVAKFTIKRGLIDDVYTLSRIPGQKMPIGFKDIQSWVDNRKGSKHNSHLKKIMEMCGCEKTEGFIRITHAASINDTFWIKGAEENVSWKDISFYHNEFNETISKLAFEGIGLYGIQLSSTSPELSTEGSFRKCWRREDNEIYLYKRGQEGARNVGLEPYSEVMASELASKICKDAVQYGLTKLHGALASKCLLFTDEQYGYVPIARFPVNHKSADDMLRFYTELGSENLFRRMLVLDALTFNVDRHAGNHGVLVNNDTLAPVQMAPIFDLNLALLPYVERDEFEKIGNKLLEYGPRIGEDFTFTGRAAMTSAIRSDLVSLKGFQFTFRGDEMFPEWRVKAIEEMINKQIEALLSKEILYTKDIFVPDMETTISDSQPETTIPSPLEQQAHGLAQKLMETGEYICYDVENVENDVQLVLFPKGNNNAEVRMSMELGDIWVEVHGKPISRFDLVTKYPDLVETVDLIMDKFQGQV
ncbi:MAG: hypothetical protein Q4C66_09775 [Lachnospiraceae bacterium]|nr:hypothetical protein [Lachnospiraceae bacterium]